MANLSTLDATQPPDGQAVSQGAARIRETRDATKTSVAAEHTLSGLHTFPRGALGGEPAAGNAGRIYLNTTLGLLGRDTGVVWQALHAISPTFVFTAGAIPITNAYGTLQSATFATPADGNILVYGQFQAGGQVAVWNYKLQLDGVDVISTGVLAAATNASDTIQLPILTVVQSL